MGIALLAVPAPASAGGRPAGRLAARALRLFGRLAGIAAADLLRVGPLVRARLHVGSEHSDNADLPLVASEYCLDPLVAPQCLLADPVEPLNSFRKWDATLEQARAASTPPSPPSAGSNGPRTASATSTSTSRATTRTRRATAATRRWTPSTPGSRAPRRWTAARTASRPSTTPAPSRSRTTIPASTGTTSPTCPRPTRAWSASRSSTTPATTGRGTPHALDKGWHLGAIGAEDLGHRFTDDWGGPRWAKTVILAEDRSEAALKAAMLARRFYAIRRPGISLTYTADGRPMGSRITRTEGKPLKTARDRSTTRRRGCNSSRAAAESSRAGSGASPRAQRRRHRSATTSCARSTSQGNPIAYSSPVWVTALRRAGRRRSRVARRRPPRAHVLLPRRVLRAGRRQHGAGRVLHARPERRAALPGGVRARPRLPRAHRPQRRALLRRPRLRRVSG